MTEAAPGVERQPPSSQCCDRGSPGTYVGHKSKCFPACWATAFRPKEGPQYSGVRCMRNRAVALFLVRRGLFPDSQEKVPIPWFQHESSTGRLRSRKQRIQACSVCRWSDGSASRDSSHPRGRNRKETVARRRKLSPWPRCVQVEAGG